MRGLPKVINFRLSPQTWAQLEQLLAKKQERNVSRFIRRLIVEAIVANQPPRKGK